MATSFSTIGLFEQLPRQVRITLTLLVKVGKVGVVATSKRKPPLRFLPTIPAQWQRFLSLPIKLDWRKRAEDLVIVLVTPITF
jgi:hypothetical protein